MTKDTPDFTFKETQGANGFNYHIKGVGNLYPDDSCTDEKLALIAASPKLLSALEGLISSAWLSIDYERNRTPEAMGLRLQAIAAIDEAKGR